MVKEDINKMGMKARYGLSDMTLKISNVTPREAENSYVLITASDGDDNEIVFELSYEQAERLEAELFEANRRRNDHLAVSYTLNKPESTIDPVSH
jgi:hypothetical protein